MRLLRLLGYQPRSCHSSSRKNSFWSGSKVRQTFLDYFEREQHLIVPSSSVIPTKLRGESPLPFVNAGMVKWRPIFTDEVQPPARFMDGVANSQKCIRIGGKACDLEHVGHDGHHHTFFEMLGSWAFNGSYGRTRSFQLAWDLLTKGYELPKDRLYVTYFSGCDKLGLPPDIESKEAWLALGLDLDRIHPMGVSDNFWQMGVDGPCGPCTEIYYSRDGSPDQKSWLEVWNLVFMEHNLHLDGSLSPLKHHHVDTGMGLERMTAIVSAMTSNYDTDLFTPLFDIIAKESNSRPYTGNFTDSLDTAYRILADHSRMVTVCLSDGLLPDASPKLRNVLRRTFRLQTDVFGISDPQQSANLTFHLAMATLDSLRLHYSSETEEERENCIRSVLDFEAEHLRQQEAAGVKVLAKLKSERPHIADRIDILDANNFAEAFKILDKHKELSSDELSTMSGDVAFKICDSLGLRSDELSHVCDLYGISYDEPAYKAKMATVKDASKYGSALKSMLEMDVQKPRKTDDTWKYQYEKDGETRYNFPLVEAEILAIANTETGVTQIKLSESDKICSILLDKTSMYGEAGGQVGDHGTIVSLDGRTQFLVNDVQLLPERGQVWHIGTLKSGDFLKRGQRIKVRLNVSRRIQCMQNHTATHLLNCALHRMFRFTSQKSSFVDPDYFRFDFASLDSSIDSETVTKIEEVVNMYINLAAPVERITMENPEYSFEEDASLKEKMLETFPGKSVITFPEETYPSEVSLISLPQSVEPCCGTHVLNTADVQAFTIVSVRSLHPGQKSFKCVAGRRAVDVRQNGIDFIDKVLALNDRCEGDFDGEERSDPVSNATLLSLSKEVERLTIKLKQGVDNLPFAIKAEMSQILSELGKHVRSAERSNVKSHLEVELRHADDHFKDSPFLVYRFREKMEAKISLSKLTKFLAKDKPVLVLALDHNNCYVARASVPKANVGDYFDAYKWLDHATNGVNIIVKVRPPRGQDPKLVVNMSPVNFPEDSHVSKILDAAQSFAQGKII